MNRRQLWPLRCCIIALALVLALAVFVASTMQALGPSKSGRAVSQSMAIVSACEAYRNHPANPDRGKYPSALTMLAKPPFGGQSFLDRAKQDLIDPWGNSYRYAVVKTASGEDEVYVWCETVVAGRLKLLGAKRKADGVVEAFGAEK